MSKRHSSNGASKRQGGQKKSLVTAHGHLIALEPRMMFDGATIATAVDTIEADPAFGSSPIDRTVAERLQISGAPVTGFPRQSLDQRAATTRDAHTRGLVPSDAAVRRDMRSEDLAVRPWLDNRDRGFADRGLFSRERVDRLAAGQDNNNHDLTPNANNNAVIFIDTAVQGYDALVTTWAGQGDIILIDSTRDGIDQMMTALAGRSHLDAIHIVSHGAEGSFRVGATQIDRAAVSGTLSSAFAAIGSKLTVSGDILIYGCDVGAGTAGQRLLDAIAIATKADVAASIDDTGTILRGGDWTLENRLGVIDGATLVARDWDGLLVSALISINPSTTVLRVYNTAGTEVANSGTATGFAGGTSVGVTAGGYAVWSNAGTVGGQAVDLRAVVVTSTISGSTPDTIKFNQPSTGSNDPGFLLQTSGSAGSASMQVRWEIVLAGTNTPIAADISYTIADIDGTGTNPAAPTRESVVVSTDTLSSFQSAATTDVRFNTGTAGAVTAYGTQNELASPPTAISAARFNWLNTSSWVITYNLVRAGSTQAGFNHDGNNEFNFGTGGVTTSIPRLDLDVNDSTAAGSGATKTYVENGAAVSITDVDPLVTNPVGTVQSATVTLTNASLGDVLTVGTLTGGLTATVDTSIAGKVTINITGAATAAQYAAAFQAITYSNTTERPGTADRIINTSYTNGTFSSNVAVSTIKVIEVNDPPVAVDDGPLTTAEDTAILNIKVLANDKDGEAVAPTSGDPLTVTTATATNGTVSISADGTLNYTPNANFNGTDTIVYTISDGRGGTSTARVPITITPVNDAPTRVGTLPSRVNLDAASGINVPTAQAFADVDNATLTYTATGLPAGLTINATTGAITGTIDRSASQVGGGIYNIVVTASDGSLSTTQNFSWTITNPAPTAANDTALSVNEDTPGTTVNVLANDTDPDGDPLTITGASATNGTVVVNANGTITYTPNANFNGTDTITYAISDGQGGTATATIPVTVTAVNDAPTRVGTLPPQVGLDAQAGIAVATAGGFADVDNPTLTYSAAGLPAGLTINAATGVISGTIDRQASQPAGGIYAVVVTARDAGGLSTTQSFSWTVTNPGPTAANDTASTAEDTPIASINVRANDSDPDGDPLTVVSASAVSGTVTINPDGTLRYVPNANFNGTDTITYTISDGNGGTSTARVTVTVGAVNDAPTPVGTLPSQTNVDAQSGISVPTASGFTDIDNATLTYAATGLPAGLSINSVTGVITGIIDRSASQPAGGLYSVTVTATDAGGLSAQQRFTWTITNPVPLATNDTATTVEDTPIVIAVVPNDTDPDGDPLTVISAVAAIGQATIVGNQVQYTPPANFNGTTTITYTISDGQGGTATATITVTVTPVNDAPVAAPIAPRNTVDGATIAVSVASSFADVDGDSLSFAATGLPPGLAINPATGLITGTIDKSASQTGGGVYTATITVSDGKGGTVQQTITFNVTNPGPVASNDSASTPEDTPVIIPVLTNDSDPDGDPLTVTSASAINGTVVINADGTVTYTPNPGFSGTDTVTYQISDGNGGTSLATVTVTVADVNDLPVSSAIANQTNLDSQPITLPVAGAFSDPDGDPLTFSATGLPAGLTINAATGVISGTIDNSASQIGGGVYLITVTASDGRGGSVTSTFGWSITNPTPTATNDVAATDEDTPVRIAVLANDLDPDGDPLTVTAAAAGNGTVTINADGSLLYTPAANFNGEDTIIYSITDAEGGVSTASVTITVRPVNDAPTAAPLPNQNDDDGTSVTVPTASAFRDVDGDVLTFAATGLPPTLSIDPATGLITGTLAPESSQNGPYIVTITATDPSGRSVSTDFVWSIQNVPPAANDDIAVTNEDTVVTVAVLANDTDPDRDPLRVTTASATNGTVVINGDNTLTFTPAADFNGTAVVTYTITDGNGGFSSATLTVTVGAVNDRPESLPLLNQANLDNQTVSVNVGDFFSDKDGDALSFVASGLPAGLTISADGIVSGTIDKSASQPGGGVYTVTITATDPGGLSTTRAFVWTVTNPAPTASNDSATTQEDVAVAIPVLGNDVDPDADPLTITTATALNGTVTIGAGGVLTYTPNANFNGSDTITYVISDGNGGTSSAAVTVTVTSVNDDPVAADDVASTNEDTPVTIGVLGNDRDVDGDVLTVTTATSPNGSVTINPDGTLTFTPAANFNGPATITYEISDGNGGTSTATVTVRVDAINDAPVASPSIATTNEDSPVTVSVLANDTDPDGDPLTVTAANAPNGSVVINPDGSVTYTPNPNFNGTDIVTYTVSDGKGGFSTSTVTVTVVAVNDAPVATAIAPQTDNDADGVSLSVASTFSDIDGDVLSFTATGLPPGLTINAAGLISGTVSPNASQGGPNGDGVYTVTVTASDGNGGTVTQSFSWTVGNPAPIAANDTGTTGEDGPVTIAILSNDSDPDGDSLTVISATAPNGVIVINADGTITYTPNANFNGTDTVTYTISDGNGGTSTATAQITVNAVNDAPVVDAPIPPQTQVDNSPVSIPVAGNFSDLDNDALTFTAAGLPAGLSISAAGVISGTIDKNASQGGPNADGIYTLTVTADDGKGGTVTSIFAFTVTNPPPAATNDTAATNEDTAVTVAVLANDRDPDSDPLTVTSATSPNGRVVINPDGTLTYTPNANFNGTDTITYTISDGNGGTSTAIVTVTVAAINDAPTVDTPLPNAVGVDGAVESIATAGNFRDLDGDTLSFTAAGLPLGLSIDPVTGVISGVIDKNASQVGGGVYAIAVTASDGRGGTVTSTFTYSVTNLGPSAADDSATTPEDTPSAPIAVLANDADPDADPLTVTSASAANGTVTISPDGTLIYTPNANFNGTDTITYTISDGNGGTATATVAITVTAANDAPVAEAPLPNRTNVDSTPVSVPVAGNFSDLDGDTLTFSAVGLPTGLTIDPVTGVISGLIAANASQPNGGVYSVTVTARDGNGGAATSTFTWTITNPAPTAANDSASTTEDTPSAPIAVLANDNDPDGDVLTVTSAVAANGTVIINPDGTLVYTPDANFNGTDVITYTVSDGNGGSSTATVTVGVGAANDAPVTNGLPDLFDIDNSIVSVPIGPAFSDLDGDAITFSAAGLPTGLSINPATGQIFGQIANNASTIGGGVYTVTITADDGRGGVTATSFTWTITNTAPFAADDVGATNEDTPVTLNVLGNDTDPDVDPLTIVSATATNGSAAVNPDGTITFTPATNFNGTATVTYLITDGNGGFSTATAIITVTPVNDAPNANALSNQVDLDGDVVALPVGPLFSDIDGGPLQFTASGLPAGLLIDAATGEISGTISPGASQPGGGIYTVTVTADDGNGGTTSIAFIWTVTNPGPAAANDTATTAEDTPSAPIVVLANDADPDGDVLTVTAAIAPNGTVVINPDGTLVYTPDANFNGTDTITYTISDGNGGTSTATVTITVTVGNDAPTATPLPARANVDAAPISISIANSFADLDGDTLAFDAGATLPPGLSIDPVTGIISGVIDSAASQGGPNGDGIYSVIITASDGKGGTVSQTFSWTVTNPPPVAANDSATAAEDTSVAIDVLVNDGDPDGDPLVVTAAVAGNGRVTIGAGGVLTYTPNANFNGIDTITYAISDGNGGTSTATVTITVAATNDAPVANALPPRSNSDAAIVSVPLAGAFSDVDGDVLTFNATGLPAGLMIDAATGVVSGTIDPAASQPGGGIYSVTVTASDGQGGNVSQTFTWTITNPPPVAANDRATTAEDTLVNIAVRANDLDPDGDALAITTASAGNGTVVIKPDGTIDYTPNASFNGTDTITYTISDGNGGTSTATVAVTVTPANDPPVAAPDTATTAEDTPIKIAVLTNDTDVDGDPLTVTSATAANGSVVINPDGSVTYAPNANFNGTDTITYMISDGKGGTSTTTVTVIVAPRNDPPVAANDTGTTQEDTPVTLSVLANDRDVDGDPLSVVSATSPDGQLTINADGTITFAPNPNFNGTTTISYAITDGNGGFATASVTLTVTPVNDPPVAVNDNASTTEDTPVKIAVLANDRDADGDPLTVTVATAGNGTVVINPDGTITYTPNPNFNGVDIITYTVSDGKGGATTATVTVGVTLDNDAPVSTPIPDQANVDAAAVQVSVAGNFSDVDADPLSFSAIGLPPGLTIDPTTGIISGVMSRNASQPGGGVYRVTITAADGQGGATSRTFTWTVTNPAPTAVNDTGRTSEDTPVTLAILSNDSDSDGDPLSVTAASALNGTIAINPDGTITYTPNANFNGTDTIAYTISDGDGGTSTATIAIVVAAVNDAPVATNDAGSTNEDTPVTLAVLGNDSDVDGDPLSVTAAFAANGTVVVNPDGTITYTPNPNFNGVDTVTYTISDGKGGTSTATITIGVGIVNDPPVSSPIANQINPDATTVSVPLAARFSDPDGDPLTFTATGLPPGLSVDPLTGVISGTIDNAASQTNGGIYAVTVTASDGKGGETAQSFTWTTTNPAPTATNDSATTPEDAPVRIAVLGNDADPDADPLTVTAASAPNGTVVINPDGTLTYTPNANFNGVDTITYTISDGNGGTATARVTVTVTPVNDPPVARADSATTNEDTPVTVAVRANDNDPDGDPLTITAAAATNGTVVINTDGTITYTPNANFNGVDTVTYTISDGKGGTSTTTVTVTVNAVNDVPIAVNDPATTPEDAPVTIAVLANDLDPDGDPLTVTAATSPNGTVVINPDGTLTFTPALNFNGPATITYTVSDGKGGTTTATAIITVTPLNDPPVAGADVAATPEDTPVRIAPLVNDSDADGDPLTLISATAPNGAVAINADGTITYTPNPNFNGTDTITYQVSDGKGGIATATITVTVAPVNDAPVAANDVIGTDENVPVRIPVLANDRDDDGDALTVTTATSPNGTVVINPDGTITFAPAVDFSGPAIITYAISDGKGGTSTATVTVDVRNTNARPTDGNEVISTIGGVRNVIPVLANARDPDGDPLSILTAKVDVGIVTINPDGTIIYVAPAAYQGVATITYIVSDGRGGFVQSTVTVNVQQATADVNALLGQRDDANAADARVPDGWRVEAVRDQTDAFIKTPYPILDTVNGFKSLHGTSDLNGHRPLLEAINGASWLRGTAELDVHGSPVDGVVGQIDRIRDLRFGADRLFDPRFGDFIAKSLTGFSVRQLSTGQDQIMIESIVRDRVVYMEVRDIGKESDPRMIEYQLRTRNGKPLPDWIRMDARGLAIIERPVDAETVRLIVRAIRADGKVFDVPVIVQGATGEIQLDDAVGKKVGAAEPLAKTIALAANSADDEAARLAAVFNGQG
jgi:large repetitive protein